MQDKTCGQLASLREAWNQTLKLAKLWLACNLQVLAHRL
jgi:hypothetical protein